MPLRILPSLVGTLVILLGIAAGLSINMTKAQDFGPGAPTLAAPWAQALGDAARGYEPILAHDGE